MKQLMLDQVKQNPSQVLQLTGHHGSATLAGSGTTPGEMRAMDAMHRPKTIVHIHHLQLILHHLTGLDSSLDDLD